MNCDESRKGNKSSQRKFQKLFEYYEFAKIK